MSLNYSANAFSTSPPTAAKDFATKKVKVTEDGQPVMVVRLLAMDGSDSTMIKFNLAGEQHHLVLAAVSKPT
ncbi:hypothetical protein [Nonomuraea sp. B5E05]|uniref:hypothetical protein n=1 Tax=Nonomuraea sp. B5E05 TaxID=3153569 RepID=UPI00326110F5